MDETSSSPFLDLVLTYAVPVTLVLLAVLAVGAVVAIAVGSLLARRDAE